MHDTNTASVQALAARLGEFDERPEDAITAAAALRLLAAERDALRKERDEDQCVIAVWRGRTTRAEAERDALRAAAEAAAAAAVPVAWVDAFGEPFRTRAEIDGEADPLYARPVLTPVPTPQPATAGVVEALAKIEAIVDLPREPSWAYRNTITNNRNAIREQVAAARAALSTPMQAVPLTPDELADKCEAWLQGPDSFMCNNPVDAYEAGFRAAESHHGITGDKHGN